MAAAKTRTTRPPENTADAVADAIAADIAAGVMGGGAWLKQIDIEGRYRCTRATARRALEALAVRGTIQRIPQRGYYVAALNEATRRELAEVRAILEAGSAESIVEQVADRDIRDLRRLAADFGSAVKNGDALQRYAANRAFHVRLTSLCANKELVKIALALRGDLPTTPLLQWSSQGRIEQSAREHADMLDALVQRDARRLAATLALHIRQPGPPRAAPKG
jgi:DNA-binding GntR family transcriptional regulator